MATLEPDMENVTRVRTVDITFRYPLRRGRAPPES
jgi:hypothetical protein